jgi:hypothetical protein
VQLSIRGLRAGPTALANFGMALEQRFLVSDGRTFPRPATTG